MSDHDIGDVVSLWVVFRDEDGAQAAPTSVTLRVRKPDGTVFSSLERPAVAADETRAEAATGETLTGVVGVYRSDVTIDQSGTWRYAWTGTGTVTEIEQGAFDVRADRVGTPPGTLEVATMTIRAAFAGTSVGP